MLTKKQTDHITHHNPLCGTITSILSAQDYEPLDIAIAIDIRPTHGHYHNKFDEIYFVLDGTLTLKLYDPQTEQFQVITLSANELCVITKGIHHQIIEASENNRLCAICVPNWSADDEHVSPILIR